MKLSHRIFTVIVLMALLVVTVGVTTQPARAQQTIAPYTCFPTCSTTDGRFMALAGAGFQTLAGDSIVMEIAVPAGTTSFDIGVFDGDTGGQWDNGTTPSLYRVDNDPLGDGSGSVVAVPEISGAVMADNAWYNITVNTSDAAKSPSGNYFYHIHISNSDPTKASQNSFKIRTTGNVEMAPEAFAFVGSLITLADAKVIYPNYPSLTTTTYDGNWDMFAYVPSTSPAFSVWDGDLDYGSADCTINHTPDPETPAGVPAWAVNTAAVPDGGYYTNGGINNGNFTYTGIYSNMNCKNSANQNITGPDGQIYSTGNPPDNNNGSVLRNPSVNYDIITPDGFTYHDGNPSGNLMWNQFVVSNNQADVPNNIPDQPGNKADYFHSGLLPAGIYHAQIHGMDMHNLNAWRFNNYLLGVCEDGTPCGKILFPYNIGDTVWNDLNGNGIQDANEPGITGVTVNLLDTNNQVINTTTTDSNGQYFFDVDKGTYSVQVVPPTGYNFTKQFAGTDTTADSNINPSTGVSDSVVISSANDLTIDAGLYQPVTIGNFVWNDQNGNGLQDTNEPGITGVTVNLLGSDGTTVVDTTTTATDGSYSFTTTPGTYSVQVVAPSGESFTSQYAGTDKTIDSNANVSTGTSEAITLASGATDNTIDFGLYQPVTIGNFVWNDQNGNGIQDTNEPGIAGVTVNLLGSDGTSVVATTTTATDGSYSFTTAPGTYTVQFVAPSGYSFTTKNAAGSTTGNDSNANTTSGKADAITLASGSSDNTIDAGLYLPVTIGNFVWNDVNGNGIQDTNETGIQGVTVNLLGSDGTSVVATTTSASDGSYSFTTAPGTYTVQFVQPSNYTFTGQYAGTDTTVDSNANTTSGKADAITLASGGSDNTIDAGLYQPVTIGNFVWNDLNANGIQDTNETGIQGVTINLLGSDGSSVVATTTSASDGSYSFTAAPGTYTVQFVQPSNYTFTTKNAAGSTTANDSNANTTSGKADAITLASGGSDNTIDAGLYQPVTIGNFVWNDLNGNGIQDTNEPGIQGVTVNLLGSDGSSVVATTTTASDGSYSFTTVPGTYTVQFVQPTGYSFTTKNAAGSTTANDSNANTASGKADAITLASGGSDNTIDAGLYLPVTIGNFVWNDLNGNGIQDTNEPGIQGVTVNLLGSDGSSVVATTTTASDGSYSFTTVPGTYTVQFVQPTGFNFTTRNAAGSTTANDSNANTSSGKADAITLASGGSDNTIDAGLIAPSTPTPTATNTATATPTATYTATFTPTATYTATATNTATFTPTATYTSTATNTATFTPTATFTKTATNTATFTPTATFTKTATNTATFTPTATFTKTYTPTATNTATATATATNTRVPTVTPTPTAILYQIGDFVWNDVNGNGIQDNGETGIQGVTVKLLGSNGTSVLGTTTTDANGKYSFTVAPGTYYVQFVSPSGYVFTQYLQGSNSAVDSNANPANSGKSAAITVAAQSDNTWDAGLVVASCTTGTGTWNFNAPVGALGTSQTYTVNGLTITAYGYTSPSTATALYGKNDAGDEHGLGIASDGDHEIDTNHYIQLDLSQLQAAGMLNAQIQIGSMQAGEPSAVYGSNTLGSLGTQVGTMATTVDNTFVAIPGFPTYRYYSVKANAATPANVTLEAISFNCTPVTYTIGDTVWNDLNGNGIQDTGEAGIAGVTVKLLGSNGTTVVSSTTTDTNGKYSFTVSAGNYYVQFAAPTGFSFTTKNAAGSTTANDSNANTATGTTDAITVSGNDNTIDAGLYQPATIGDKVWNDVNGNGVQDTGEAGVAGVTVKLLGSDGTTVVATTTTDANGKYSFSVPAGTYYVQFVSPSGYVFTQYLKGTNTAVDSNASLISNGKSAAITLAAGQTDTSWDAGLSAATCTTGTGTWNFNAPVGALGTSQTYTVNGLTITAYGYTSPSTATALYGKNDAGDEHGLGIASDGDHEIDTNHYIQLDLSQLQAAGMLNAQIQIGSMQAGEPSAVYGSNTLGSLGTQVGTMATTVDNTFVAIPGFPTYRYYSVKANAAAPANVTLEAISFNCTLPTYTIGDTVWNDANGNGIQDTGEAGVAGVTVNLLGSNGSTVVSTTTTDSNGKYSFTVNAGTYSVQFVLPGGYNFSAKNAAGSTTANDSNANTATGITDAITVTVSGNDNTIDAGLKPTVNYCAAIRTPGFWKNYSNHMTDATFLSLVQHTQDFSTLTIAQAVTILGTNNGTTKIGIPALDGTDASYLKFLLTSEINAIWNGQDASAGLSGLYGTGTYQGTNQVVNAMLHQAYTDRKSCSTAETNFVLYEGAGGENVAAGSCQVQP